MTYNQSEDLLRGWTHWIGERGYVIIPPSRHPRSKPLPLQSRRSLSAPHIQEDRLPSFSDLSDVRGNRCDTFHRRSMLTKTSTRGTATPMPPHMRATRVQHASLLHSLMSEIDRPRCCSGKSLKKKAPSSFEGGASSDSAISIFRSW